MDKTCMPVSIMLKMHGETYTTEGLPWDSDADSLKEAFSRLLVCAAFSPDVIEEDGGRWEWVDDD